METSLEQVDVIVLGTGAAALASAITAAHAGLQVVMLERDDVVGGTSALSGGALWIPMSRQAREAGVSDSPSDVRRYLRQVLGEGYRAEIVDSFLRNGPEALAFLEEHAELRYALRPLSPDYYPEFAGATDSGRVLEMGEFDGRRLGPWFEKLRPPLKGLMGFGGMMVNKTDVAHFMGMRRSLRSVLHMAGLTARFLLDRIGYSRGTRLVIGNAMVAALLKSALEHGVQIRLQHCTTRFVVNDRGTVAGVEAIGPGGRLHRLIARRGVVLGTGGLSHRPGVEADRPGSRADHRSLAAPMSDGSMIEMAQRQLGAALGDEHLRDNFYWAPMSFARIDGRDEVFPHIMLDRARPGIIAVNDRGERFVNEADSYHRFVQAMLRQQRHGATHFHLIADARALARHGLGFVRPRPGPHGRWLMERYLIQAPSIAALARRLGIDSDVLEGTVADFNAGAAKGVDTRFHRGESSYNQAMGDAAAPHPNLAPLLEGPFYAVRIVTGDLGSAKGLVTDACARVHRPDGRVIEGLYAVGTDMNSPVSGTYPGPGIVLGTGLTFGYVAGRTIASAAGSSVSAAPASLAA